MPLSVLLVDDTAFLRSMLREILESGEGFRVAAEASDGVAALALQPELRPDLVVSDLIMPGLDGIELTRTLVDADPSVKVVVTAAADQEGALVQALAAGAADFLAKPYWAPQVLRILRECATLPEAGTGEERLLRLRVTLDPSTPFPAHRLNVILARCRQRCAVLAAAPEASAPAGSAPPSLEVILRTRSSAEALQGWMAGLYGVVSVEAKTADRVPASDADSPAPPPSKPLPGMVRIRTALLDRLLNRLEESEADRDRLALALGIRPDSPESLPLLSRLERNLAQMRAEILATRLVPFDRIAPRLERCVAESARASSRLASLTLVGGDCRVDLAVLEEVAALLARLLPRLVESCIVRSDILRQLGRSEGGRLELRISRGGSVLALAVGSPDPAEAPPADLLAGETLDRIRRLGGSAGIAREGTGWRVEMVFPAGVAVVRSYLCQAGKHLFAVPVTSVEKPLELDASQIRFREGRSFWEENPEDPIPLLRFAGVPWVDADGPSGKDFPGLLYRVGPQRYAVAVDALLGETDVVVRPTREPGGTGATVGTALLPDGGVALVPDLPHLARML